MSSFLGASRTGSSTATFKKNGETLAIAHKTATKPGAYDPPKPMSTTSTNRESYKDPNMKQSLSKYHPNAQRNRLPVKFKGEAVPCVRFCQVRNEHTYDFLKGKTQPGFNPYRTTSKNFYSYDVNMLAIGESNQGIVSEKAKQQHEKSLM